MLRWMKRLLSGGQKDGDGDTDDSASSSPHLGPEWEASKKAQRQARQQHKQHTPQDGPTYGRLEISLGEEKIPEKRKKQPDRRHGDDRRDGPKDRRVRDIPVKEERRRNQWDRRRQYGERRFVQERRTGRESRDPQKDMQVYTTSGEALTKAPSAYVPVSVPAPATSPGAPTPGGISAPPPQPAISAVPENSTPLPDSSGKAIAYVCNSLPAGQYGLHLMDSEPEQLTLRLDSANAIARLSCGTKDHALAIPCAMAPQEQLILTVRGSFILHLDTSTRSDIILGAEKLRLNLMDILQKKLPVTTLVLGAIGSDIEMVEPQHFRFGGVTLHFDLTQTVEILTASGERVRISGPAGIMNFARYKEGLAA